MKFLKEWWWVFVILAATIYFMLNLPKFDFLTKFFIDSKKKKLDADYEKSMNKIKENKEKAEILKNAVVDNDIKKAEVKTQIENLHQENTKIEKEIVDAKNDLDKLIGISGNIKGF